MNAIIKLPLVPMRLNASEQSELTSQLLYGEIVQVIKEEDKWCYVINSVDQYSGWVDSKMLILLANDEYNTMLFSSPVMITSPIMEFFESETSEKMYLPAGSIIRRPCNGNFIVNSKKVDLESYFLEDLYNMNSQHLIYVAKQFLNAPYLWGGKSIFGIDCSGFVQLCFSICGMQLPRDAGHQLIFGRQVDFLIDARVGDLAFFEDNLGEISHVGIMINNHQIIHASGKVKIENIDVYGIISSSKNDYSHKLSVIKRYF